MINITYAVTVCNELEEITKLINFLHPRIQSDDEILIQYDEDSATDAVKQYLLIVQFMLTDESWLILFLEFDH